MKKIVTFSGRGGIGKSVLALKTALALEREKKYRVALVLSDPMMPGIPYFFPPGGEEKTVSLGRLLTGGHLTGALLISSFLSRRKNPNLGVTGYLPGECALSYPEITKTMCESFFSLLEEYVDIILVDGSAYLKEPLTSYALSLSDVRVLICDASLPSALYAKSYLSEAEKDHLSPRNLVLVGRGREGEKFFPARDVIVEGKKPEILLPDDPALRRQAEEGRLWDDLPKGKLNAGILRLKEAILA
ncbi:MAG: hypothetical protein II797_03855 [Clostridia bacterium]|nr:hypothetical protein [Clostridia bacterium]